MQCGLDYHSHFAPIIVAQDFEYDRFARCLAFSSDKHPNGNHAHQGREVQNRALGSVESRVCHIANTNNKRVHRLTRRIPTL